VKLVREELAKRGLMHQWVIEAMGLKPSAGRMMLRLGCLPTNQSKREQALKRLSEIVGMEVENLLLYPQQFRKAAGS
jgi:hypothetical protein